VDLGLFLSISGRLERSLGLGGPLQIEEDDAEGIVVRGVLGIELDGLP